VKAINQKISKNIRDPYLLNKFQRPCSVFASFESEEGRARALVYNDLIQQDFKQYEKFLGSEIELQEASEPTDIIWENRSITPRSRSIKRVVVYSIIAAMLTVSAAIIYTCTTISTGLKTKYPKVDCKQFAAVYAGDEDTWASEAGNEFLAND
jgi:hypothetical protein